MSNRTFFKRVKEGHMSFGDIFSDVTRRHTAEETSSVFISGTSLTTPKEDEMLSGWIKPFLFARFFVMAAAMLLLVFILGSVLDYSGAYYLLMVGIPFIVPLTILLLVWEMNVPRNISLYEVIQIVAIGGILSIIAAVIGFRFDTTETAVWAGLVEEPAKLLVIYLLLRRKNYTYALNGILLGVAVGTGFAIMESLIYTWSNFYNGVILGVNLVLADKASESIIWSMGVYQGLGTALVRAITAISGHGIYAGLYGGALVKVKGTEEVQVTHLLKFDFLKYFAISILLHALHNLGPDLGLPTLFDGMLPSEYLIIAVIALCLLLPCLRDGVNQIVTIASRKNGGRVTQAVNHGDSARVAAPQGAAQASGCEAQLQCITGPSVGQVYRIQSGQTVTLGRTAGKNDISLPGCDNVSGLHCRIAVNGSLVTVTDLGSTNGTYLDNQRLTPQQPMTAMDGAVICLGSKNCSFRLQIR